MGIGIQICGLNGCGKSTLGKALAEKLDFHFIDNENLYFAREHANEPYTNPKSEEEVERLLINEVIEHPNFIFSAVRGNYGKEIIPMYNYVVVIEAPKEVRSQRVRNRSFQKFGKRMLIGGDLYEREEAFFRMSHEDKQFAKEYYFKKCVKPMGISRELYEKHLDLFLFYEYCEWIYVGNKFGDTDNDRFRKYLNMAKEMAIKLGHLSGK